MGLRGPKARPERERFAEKTAQGENGCVMWTAGTNRVGYGIFHVGTFYDNRKVYAHRWAYEHAVGPIPEGLHLDHLCRDTLCVNPEHLEPVTPRENVLRGVGATAINARKSHCPKGHPYSGNNLYVGPGGNRKCRECGRIRDAARRPRRRTKKRS